MKGIFTIVLALLFSFSYSQKTPNISINSLDGKKVNISQIDSSTPVVFSFWATWCLPCMEELTAINEKMETWQQDTKFSMYAVSTDDARTSQKVKTMVKSKGWEYNILMDTNQTLKRALNISTIPYTMIVHNGEIVYKHVGYSPGDEDELLAKIKEYNETVK